VYYPDHLVVFLDIAALHQQNSSTTRPARYKLMLIRPVNLLNPFLEPSRFLEKDVDEHQGCDWNRNNKVKDAQDNKVN